MRLIAPSTFLAEPLRKFQISLLMLLLLIIAGSAGYMGLERMEPVDAVYMTVITISTVGFMEVTPLSPAGRIFTIVLVILGVGGGAWAIRNGVEITLGDTLYHSVRRRKMTKTIESLNGHYIVCGFGRIGMRIAHDMSLRNEPFLIVERDPVLIEVIREKGFLLVEGDATQDETLIAAGIERAKGLVSTLNSDADNVLAVLTARGLNPALLIVARAGDDRAESKLRRAGADRVVSPYAIGGHRLAQAMLQPAVHDFFNRIFHTEQADVDIDEIAVEKTSPLMDQSIADSDLRTRWGLTVIGIRQKNGEFQVSPEPDRKINEGETLIVIGRPERVAECKRAVRKASV